MDYDEEGRARLNQHIYLRSQRVHLAPSKCVIIVMQYRWLSAINRDIYYLLYVKNKRQPKFEMNLKLCYTLVTFGT